MFACVCVCVFVGATRFGCRTERNSDRFVVTAALVRCGAFRKRNLQHLTLSLLRFAYRTRLPHCRSPLFSRRSLSSVIRPIPALTRENPRSRSFFSHSTLCICHAHIMAILRSFLVNCSKASSRVRYYSSMSDKVSKRVYYSGDTIPPPPRSMATQTQEFAYRVGLFGMGGRDVPCCPTESRRLDVVGERKTHTHT